jgi:DNA modification methylase
MRGGRLVCGDNLVLLRGLPEASLDLIYIDPPYASGNRYPGAYDDDWPTLEAYLAFLRPRLVEMRRTLADTGSLFVHLDQNASHYAKVELDAIFGREQYRGEIIWQKIRVKKSQSIGFPRIHDSLLWYARGALPTYRHQHVPLDPAYIRSHYRVDPATGRRFQLVSLIQDGPGPVRRFGDRELAPPPGKHWIWGQARIDAAMAEGRIRFTRGGRPRLVRDLDEAQGHVLGDVWTDIPPVNSQAAERTVWPTQKPEALLERILSACSNPGDRVADFFCGSGTTGVVAARLGRRFLLCDRSPAAIALARERLQTVRCKTGARGVERPRGTQRTRRDARHGHRSAARRALQGRDAGRA